MSIQQVVSIKAPQSATGEAGGQSVLGGYAQGDVLTGVAVSVDESGALLLLENGQQVRAALGSGVTLAEQDQVSLLLTERAPSQVLLQLISQNGQPVQAEATVLESLLLQAGADVSPQGLELAQTLARLSLPVRPETLEAMRQGLARFPTLSPDMAGALAAQGLPITRDNIQALTQWLTASSAEQASQQLRAYLHRPGVADQLTALLTQEAPPQPGQLPDAVPQPGAGGAEAAQSQTPAGDGTAAARPGPFQAASGAASAPSGTALSPSAAPVLSQSAASELNLQGAQSSHPSPSDPAAARQSTAAGQSAAAAAPQGGALPESGAALQSGTVPESGWSALLQRLLVKGGTSRPIAGEQQASAVQQAAPASPQNPGLRTVLDTLFPQLSPREEGNGERLALGERKWTGALHQLRAWMAGDATAPNREVEQLLQQNRMGEQFQHFYYTQLPYTAQGREQMAQLYVMKRNPRHVRMDSDNLTVLLSLSTQSLGQVESVIRVQESALQLTLRTDSDQAKERLRAEVGQLRPLLASIGYPLKAVEFTRIDAPLSPLTAAKIAGAEHSVPVSGLNLTV